MDNNLPFNHAAAGHTQRKPLSPTALTLLLAAPSSLFVITPNGFPAADVTDFPKADIKLIHSLLDTTMLVNAQEATHRNKKFLVIVDKKDIFKFQVQQALAAQALFGHNRTKRHDILGQLHFQLVEAGGSKAHGTYFELDSLVRQPDITPELWGYLKFALGPPQERPTHLDPSQPIVLSPLSFMTNLRRFHGLADVIRAVGIRGDNPLGAFNHESFLASVKDSVSGKLQAIDTKNLFQTYGLALAQARNSNIFHSNDMSTQAAIYALCAIRDAVKMPTPYLAHLTDTAPAAQQALG